MRLIWLGTAWLAGIAIGRFAGLEAWPWILMAAVCFMAVILLRRHAPYARFFTLLLFAALGAARLQSALPDLGPQHVASHNDTGGKVSLQGIVVGYPDVRDRYIGLRVRAQSVAQYGAGEGEPAEGLVLVMAPRYGDFAYGDRIRAIGVLETPPEDEDFSYRAYLSRKGIHSMMPYAGVKRLAEDQANPVLGWIYDFRSRALETVYALFPDPDASLLAGILLGLESGIPEEVQEQFNATGTSHIIAISGFNITILSALFFSQLRRWLGARWGAIAAVCAIGLYTVFVGAEAAVVRAAIMGGLVLLATRLGRQSDALTSLMVAAVLMTAINPQVLWDVGFQLSFAATLGLVLYAPGLQAWFDGLSAKWLSAKEAKRLSQLVGECVLFTLAAQVTTLPLTAYYFRRLSLSSLIANPVILPAQPAVMVLGGLATLAGCLWLPLGRPLSWIAWPFVAFTTRSVALLAQLPSASIGLGEVALAPVAGYYVVLLCVPRIIRLTKGWWGRIPRVRVPAAAGLTALALATGLVWRVYADHPDGRLHLTVLDVGGGEAVLVRTPKDRFLLVGGGPSPIALSEELGRRLPFLRRRLDWVVVGGTREDQVAGLMGIVDRYPIGGVLLAGPPGSGSYRRLMEKLDDSGIPLVRASEGQAMDLGGGARLEVLVLGEKGAILRVQFGRASVLLCPGADPKFMEGWDPKAEGVPVTAVMLPDGGYEAVNPGDWLQALHPRLALISVESGNRRGLPSPEVLGLLEGTTVLRTDRNGWIELSMDGSRLWVEVERGSGSETE